MPPRKSKRLQPTYCRVCGACTHPLSPPWHKPGCPLLNPDTHIEVIERPTPWAVRGDNTGITLRKVPA